MTKISAYSPRPLRRFGLELIATFAIYTSWYWDSNLGLILKRCSSGFLMSLIMTIPDRSMDASKWISFYYVTKAEVISSSWSHIILGSDYRGAPSDMSHNLIVKSAEVVIKMCSAWLPELLSIFLSCLVTILSVVLVTIRLLSTFVMKSSWAQNYLTTVP